MTLLAGRLLDRGREREGWLRVRGERVAELGFGALPGTPDVAHDGLIARGFCDLQVNGAVGVEVTGGRAALEQIDAAMLAHGVTSYLPTVISTDEATASRAVETIAAFAGEPASPIEGVHLEGPFLSERYHGMHRRSYLRLPVDGLPSYYESPAVRMVTVAPELDGARPLIEALAARPGLMVSLGHSGASATEAASARRSGAGLVTHVFNAMAPLHHRRPGLVGWALSSDDALLGVIADGVHIDPLVLSLLARVARARILLVSDAGPGAGAPAGRYELAGLAIDVALDGSCRTLDGALAGSSLFLDEAVRRWRDFAGVSLAEAVESAGARPAALLGLPGALAPGAFADLVLLTADGHIASVMRRGGWVA